MEDSKKARLSLLKKEQADKGKEEHIAMLRNRFISVCSDFTDNYRFPNDNESAEIIMALRKIPTNRTGVVDLSRNPDVLEFQRLAELAEYKNNQIWVCCNELSENIFVNCVMDRFVEDFENWQEISDSFILLFHNLTDYIYIDEYGAKCKCRRME